jgi:hypothetical protein
LLGGLVAVVGAAALVVVERRVSSPARRPAGVGSVAAEPVEQGGAAAAPEEQIGAAGAERAAAQRMMAEQTVRGTVRLAIESEPSGASIFRDRVLVGATPLVQEAPRGAGQVEFVLKLRGYRDARVRLPLGQDGTVRIALERARAHTQAAPATEKPKPPAASKPVKNGVIDPF